MKRIFLLGGHDLEMLTIRNLLIENGEIFRDAQLRWDNARLSNYSDCLNDQDVFYGIELREDCPFPKHYRRIDHHNELPAVPTALEQVATLLGITLNRWQQLVAANDYGYIPAMQQMGATADEIQQVRLADRRTQDVTEQDEELAKCAICNNLLIFNDLIIVKTESHHFSPICDKLFPYGKLLVYSDTELTYYGTNSKTVATHFANEISCGKAFTGGGQDGYFGLAKGFFSKEEILHYVETIKSLTI